MKVDPQVQAETARYIDGLGPANLHKAHEYTIGGHWLLLWGLVVSAIVTWLIVRSGILDRLDGKLGEPRRNLRAFAVSATFFSVSAVVSLPWTL